MEARHEAGAPMLRIGVMPAAPLRWVRAATAAVRRRHPRLMVVATSVWADDGTLARVSSGEIDVAVVVGPVMAPGVLVRDLGHLEVRAYVGPEHPLSQHHVIDYATLLEQPTFRRPDGVSTLWRDHWLLVEDRGGEDPSYLDVAATTEWDAVLAIGSTRAVGFAPAGWAAGAGLHTLVVRDAPLAPVQMLWTPREPESAWARHFREALSAAAADGARVPAAEARVADLAARGLTNREISEALHVSARTVETQLASVLRRLGLRNRTELAATWRERGGITDS